MSKYRLLAVIDNTQGELWEQLELEVGVNTCAQVAAWMTQQVRNGGGGDEFDYEGRDCDIRQDTMSVKDLCHMLADLCVKYDYRPACGQKNLLN